MASISIYTNYMKGSLTSEVTSVAPKIQSLPTLEQSDIDSALLNMIESEQTSGSIFANAKTLLAKSSHTEGTFGSPGTLLMVPVKSGSIQKEYDALIVNEKGQISTSVIKRSLNGWIVEGNSKTLPSFSDLTQVLLSGMQDIVGSDVIPFLSGSSLDVALIKLSQAKAGTYLAFAHTPVSSERAEENLVSPVKRNILVWSDGNGKLEEAHFHYDPSSSEWLNGGPNKAVAGEKVISDKTLTGLIEKKIFLSLGRVDINPLSLD